MDGVSIQLVVLQVQGATALHILHWDQICSLQTGNNKKAKSIKLISGRIYQLIFLIQVLLIFEHRKGDYFCHVIIASAEATKDKNWPSLLAI